MLSRLCEIGASCWVAGDVTGALYKMQRHLTAERAILEVKCLLSVKKACAPYIMHAFVVMIIVTVIKITMLTIIVMITTVKRCPAHDEPGTCRTTLVTPEQPVLCIPISLLI